MSRMAAVATRDASTGGSARLFLALWPDEPALDAIAAWQAAFGWPERARPHAREAWHLTLHFLGDVPRARLPEMVLALRGPVEPFEVELDAATVWHGGIAVLESTRIPPALAALHARLGTVLHALSLRVDERPYRPHVTLARHAQGACVPTAPGVLPRWRASSWALVESAGGRYTTLAAFGERAGGMARGSSAST